MLPVRQGRRRPAEIFSGVARQQVTFFAPTKKVTKEIGPSRCRARHQVKDIKAMPVLIRS
jgi:hypothetical protein